VHIGEKISSEGFEAVDLLAVRDELLTLPEVDLAAFDAEHGTHDILLVPVPFIEFLHLHQDTPAHADLLVISLVLDMGGKGTLADVAGYDGFESLE
jgi:hypothetical protein